MLDFGICGKQHSPREYDKKPGANFINVLWAAFTHTDPESVTIQLSHQYLFTLLRSKSIKAALRMLMKLTPGANVPNFFIWEYYSYIVFLTTSLSIR